MRAHGGSNPHRIVPHGPDRMVLTCSRSGQGIIEAKRPENGKTWTLVAHGSDADDRVVETDETRSAAIDAMISFAYETLPHEGIEVHVPARVASDGETIIQLRDEP
jgi:hypothetical protein